MFHWPRSCFFLFVGGLVSCSESKDDRNDESPCVVARHVDQCCSGAVPASVDDMSKDGCLQREQRAPAVETCSKVSDCNKVACGARTPPTPSRVAKRSGGSCVFANECESDADCVLATNEAYCCGCPEWLPRSLLATDPCFSTATAPVSAECVACPAVSETSCSPCSATTAAGRCVDGGHGYKQCVSG
ncbi:MAG: hypothetical protein JW940_09490 [Polyangiaceae bacterium]|nr:hypothetical protein [Polyangiaceae bacterium]